METACEDVTRLETVGEDVEPVRRYGDRR